MSVQQLSDAVERLGMIIQRPVLSNLENGRRDTVSIAEWLVLAAALQVPPLLLLFPVGRVDVVEPLPGVEVSPWAAVNWAEHGRLTGLVESDAKDALAIHEYRRHEEFERMWEQSRHEVRRLRELLAKPTEWLEQQDYHPAELWSELAERERLEERALAMLRELRRSLAGAGIELPVLSPSLARTLGEQHEGVAP